MSELERIFNRVSTRLNNVLCEMKPGYDDSIVGFNEAWDVMRAVFKDELTKAASRTPDEPQAAPEWPDVAEDDPEVVLAARAIAEHGIGRPWDDFLPTNAYDVDHSDLIEYGRAAVAAIRASSQVSRPHGAT